MAPAATHRDTPPVDDIRHGRSPGSQIIAHVGLPSTYVPVALSTQAHCLQLRGQLRPCLRAPASLLALVHPKRCPKNHDRSDIGSSERQCQSSHKEMLISLHPHRLIRFCSLKKGCPETTRAKSLQRELKALKLQRSGNLFGLKGEGTRANPPAPP